MNNTTARKWLSFILCLALIAAIALTAMGCDQAKTPETPETTVAGDETAALIFHFLSVIKKERSAICSNTDRLGRHLNEISQRKTNTV